MYICYPKLDETQNPPATFATESPTPIEAYANDMMAASMESQESSWKFGIWLKTIWMHANIIMNG